MSPVVLDYTVKARANQRPWRQKPEQLKYLGRIERLQEDHRGNRYQQAAGEHRESS
jgi:hypothetical protein